MDNETRYALCALLLCSQITIDHYGSQITLLSRDPFSSPWVVCPVFAVRAFVADLAGYEVVPSPSFLRLLHTCHGRRLSLDHSPELLNTSLGAKKPSKSSRTQSVDLGGVFPVYLPTFREVCDGLLR
jgi:hypothetical protein